MDKALERRGHRFCRYADDLRDRRELHRRGGEGRIRGAGRGGVGGGAQRRDLESLLGIVPWNS